MLYRPNIIHSNVDVDLAMFHIIDSDLVRSCGHTLFELLNPIVALVLVCTLFSPQYQHTELSP